MYSDIKFHKKSTQWDPNCSMQMDGRTGTMKPVTFCNFADMPKNVARICQFIFINLECPERRWLPAVFVGVTVFCTQILSCNGTSYIGLGFSAI